MDISLNSDIERIIGRQVRSGKYPSAADVIRKAVLLLDERERLGQADPLEAADEPAGHRRSPRGILADIRNDISPDDIRQVREEMWAGFPRDEG